MTITSLLALLLIAALTAYWLGYRRSLAVAKPFGRRSLHSLPVHYATFSAIWTVLPALLIVALWLFLHQGVIHKMVWTSLPEHYQQLSLQEQSLVVNQIEGLINDIKSNSDLSTADADLLVAANYMMSLQKSTETTVSLACVLVTLLSAAVALWFIRIHFRARNQVETVVRVLLMASSFVAVLTTVGIVLSVLFEAIRFFKIVSPFEFLFGLSWSPQIAMRADQAGSSGAFGAVPLFNGTILISLIAMFVAAPIGLMSAIYLSEYATSRMRSMVKPVLEILAGIPTVVYGFFAALTVAPLLRDWGTNMGMSLSSESALATGLVMGIMIIPFISSISDDVIHAVPQSMRDGSLGLGATRSETILKVVIPAALPGIVGGMMLAISRAIGETMIVVMAAGLSANLTFNPLESVTTVTVQIVTLLTGDQEFDSSKTLAAFALGLMLFLTTLVLNIIALHIVNKYREQYE
jgi:phosphate transport system permease protein